MSKITDFFGARKAQPGIAGKKKDTAEEAVTERRVGVRSTKKKVIRESRAVDIRDAFKQIEMCFATSAELPKLQSESNDGRVKIHQVSRSESITGSKRKAILSPVFDAESLKKRCKVDTSEAEQLKDCAPCSARKRIFTLDHKDDHSAVVGTSAQLSSEKADCLTENGDVKTPQTKLSLNDVKERLMNCSKLSELRQCLSRINDCAAKVKEFQVQTKSPVKINVHTKAEEEKQGNPIVPITSPKKFLAEKVSPKKNASQRLLYLARKEHEAGLVLPFKFRTLLEVFRCTDTVVSMLHNRDEICTFAKLKNAVEKMTRKMFDTQKLSQILTVFPGCYSIHYERIMGRMSSELQMVIRPNQSNGKMSPAALIERKQTFSSSLLNIVKKAHTEFLLSSIPPVEVDPNSLKRWHPHFKLEEIPDISANGETLPAKPSQPVAKTFSTILPKDEDDSQNPLTKTEDETMDPPKISSGVLKGISTKLLLKVKAKEAKLIAREMVRNSAEEQKLVMMKRLPEIMKLIHNYFISDKKSTLPIEEVVRKCVDSYHSSISAYDVHQHITLLAEALPDWLFLLKVSKGTYVKIDKNKTLTTLFKRLDDMTNLLKRS